MTLPTPLNEFLFSTYPYICLVVFFLGSLVRFDREPYSWKSDSSQMLRKAQLRTGSNLFHYGVIVVLLGHFFGFLMPESIVLSLMSPTQHQLLAMVVGGIAGVFAIIGMSILIYRRLYYRRIRGNSRKWDITVVILLWLQLALGLCTVPLSAMTMGTGEFERVVGYVQAIAYFHGNAAAILAGMSWVYKAHILLGFTLFLITPFTRLVHIWSGIGSLAYLFRPYQLVRKRARPAHARAGKSPRIAKP